MSTGPVLVVGFVAALLAWGIVEDSLSGPLTMPAFSFWLIVGWLRARSPSGSDSSRPLAAAGPPG